MQRSQIYNLLWALLSVLLAPKNPKVTSPHTQLGGRNHLHQQPNNFIPAPYSVTFAKGGVSLKRARDADWFLGCRQSFCAEELVYAMDQRRLFRKTHPSKRFSGEMTGPSIFVLSNVSKITKIQLGPTCPSDTDSSFHVASHTRENTMDGLTLRCLSRLRKKFSIVLGSASIDCL